MIICLYKCVIHICNILACFLYVHVCNFPHMNGRAAFGWMGGGGGGGGGGVVNFAPHSEHFKWFVLLAGTQCVLLSQLERECVCVI